MFVPDGRMFWRNVPCDCRPCINREWEEAEEEGIPIEKWEGCLKSDSVSKWIPFALREAAEEEKDGEGEAGEGDELGPEDPSGLSGLYEELGQAVVDEVQVGQYFCAVTRQDADNQPFWLGRCIAPEEKSERRFVDIQGDTQKAGTRWIKAEWFELHPAEDAKSVGMDGSRSYRLEKVPKAKVQHHLAVPFVRPRVTQTTSAGGARDS